MDGEWLLKRAASKDTLGKLHTIYVTSSVPALHMFLIRSIKKVEGMGNDDRPSEDEYPHNPGNTTCPDAGIKCVCWDIEQGGENGTK